MKHTLYTIVFAITCLITVSELVKAIIHMFKYIYMYWWFLGGGVLYYFIASIPIFKKNINFLQTLSHESLHMAACLMMFRTVESLKATAANGDVVYRGSSNMFISLAPYTMPVITILLLLIQTVIPARFIAFGIVVGFTFFFYLHSFVTQAKPYQTDLKNHGLLPSYLYIVSLASFNTAICLLAIDMKFFKAIGFYFSDIWSMVGGIFI